MGGVEATAKYQSFGKLIVRPTTNPVFLTTDHADGTER